MTSEHVVTANARTVSGAEFFDAVTGSSPEKREQRDHLMREQCIRAINRGDTYGWPPAMVEQCKLIIAERLSFTETRGDPFLRMAAE